MAHRRGHRRTTPPARDASPGATRGVPSWKRPDSALSPSQLKNRQRIRTRKRLDRDPLYNPQAPLAGANLKSAADRIVEGEFAPVENQLRRRISDTSTQGAALQGRAADYYGELAKQEQRGIQTQQALGSMLSSRVDAIGKQAQDSAMAAQNAEQQRLAADSAVRGTGLQDTSTLKETGIIAANSAQNTAAAATAAERGTSDWANLAATMAQARGLRGGEVQERLANRTLNANSLTQDSLADLAVKRGGATSKTLLDLRQQGFENIATSQTLNLKRDDLALEAENNKTQAEIERDRLAQQARDARAGRAVTIRGQNTTAATAAANRTSQENRARWKIAADGADSTKGLTPHQITQRSDEMMTDVNKAISAYQSALTRHKQQPKATRALQAQGVPANLINFARDLTSPRTGRRLSQTNYRIARQLGLVVPPQWRPKPRSRTRGRPNP